MSRALVIAALCAVVGLVAAPLHASAACESDALLLARICVSEAGWSAHESGDCGAIAYAIAATSSERAISFRAAARAHSPRATGARETSDARLSWVAGLRRDGGEPTAWPAPPHAPWAAYRERWLEVLDRARELVTWSLEDHEADSMCEVAPVTWAARWHTPSPGLVEIDCGDTRNAFFARAR